MIQGYVWDGKVYHPDHLPKNTRTDRMAVKHLYTREDLFPITSACCAACGRSIFSEKPAPEQQEQDALFPSIEEVYATAFEQWKQERDPIRRGRHNRVCAALSTAANILKEGTRP